MAELAEQAFADLEHAGYRARAEQRGPFPGLAEALVEAERALKWSHQRRVSAAGTQSHVHPKTSRRQKVGQRFAQARHRFGVGVRPVEDVNQIDIRAEVEFLRAELAQPKYAEPFGRGRLAPDDEPRALERRGDTFVGKPRHRAHRRCHVEPPNQVGNRNLQEQALLEFAEPACGFDPVRAGAGAEADGVIDRFGGCSPGGVEEFEPPRTHRAQPLRDNFGAAHAEREIACKRFIGERRSKLSGRLLA